jgi:hypothetical protein
MQMQGTLVVTFWLSLILLFPSPDGRGADSIIFKDGMRTLCHGRAWEENGQVHCEYDGGVLSYPATDVDRIVKGPSAQPQPPETSSEPQPAAAVPPPAVAASPPPSPAAEVQATPSGVLFYDPRRPQKYWSRPDRKHAAYPEAIAALSEEFERSPQWVEENMGDSNDLGIIRETLAGRRQAVQVRTAGTSADLPAGIEFYNPRRPEQYWTGPEARHTSYAEAIQALAREFGKPADWVERFMGDSNDVEQIRAALRRASASKAD